MSVESIPAWYPFHVCSDESGQAKSAKGGQFRIVQATFAIGYPF